MIIALLYGLCVTLAWGVYYPPEADIVAYHQVYKVAQAKPDDAMAQFNLAMNYAYTGRILKGLDLLKDIRATEPEIASEIVSIYQTKVLKDTNVSWKDYFKLGFGLYFTGQPDASQTAFLEAHNRNPEQVWVMGYIALLLSEQGDYDTAINWCQKALDQDYDLAGIHFLLGEAYSNTGESIKAFSHKARGASLLAEEKLAHDYIYGDVSSN